MTEAFSLRNQPGPNDIARNVLATATDSGIAVCASASLLQGRLGRNLPPLVNEAFEGLQSDAQRAVQFVPFHAGCEYRAGGDEHARACP